MAVLPADLPVQITIDVDGSGDADMIKRHPLVIFTLLTFGLTWTVWVPRAAGVPVGALGQLWTWIPAVAALIAAAVTGGREAVRDLLGRLVRWRVAWWWYPVVILGPAAFSAVVAGVYVLAGGTWQEAAPAAFQLSIPALGLFFAVLILTDGLGEELGWRGFALPRLLQRWPPVTASVILGLVWAAWHLPLLWTESATLYSSPVWLLILDICAKSILFTWVFVRTRESVLIAVLLHASINLFALPPVITSDLRLPILALIAEWLLVIIIGLILFRLHRSPMRPRRQRDERRQPYPRPGATRLASFPKRCGALLDPRPVGGNARRHTEHTQRTRAGFCPTRHSHTIDSRTRALVICTSPIQP